MSCLRDHFQRDYLAPGAETPRKLALRVRRYRLANGSRLLDSQADCRGVFRMGCRRRHGQHTRLQHVDFQEKKQEKMKDQEWNMEAP